MADSAILQTHAEKRLNTTHEAELLRSFVRINVEEDDEDDGTASHKEANNSAPTEKVDDGAIKDLNLAKIDNRNKDVKGKKGKRKKRKSGPRHEELYCDKDRAAAVNMGSKDIKQSLKLKRKQDRSKALQIPEEAEPGTFLALGNYEMCRGDLQIAIDFMSKALELNPTEKNALVARSKCYILLGQPENALKDAESALQIDKSFLKAIYQKAESLYYLGNFEHSLMYYHRGLHIRPDHEGFKLGVHKAQKAIENAIGSSFALTRSSSKAASSCCSSSKSPISNNHVCNEDNKSSVTKTRSCRKSRLLRELGKDKEYLDNLIHNPNIKCKYKEEDTTIENCIKETVDFLNARQEFWRQQLPPNFK